ncbi:MAG: hypothetical protein AAGB12_13310 [Pseudomonadota bacterium]
MKVATLFLIYVVSAFFSIAFAEQATSNTNNVKDMKVLAASDPALKDFNVLLVPKKSSLLNDKTKEFLKGIEDNCDQCLRVPMIQPPPPPPMDAPILISVPSIGGPGSGRPARQKPESLNVSEFCKKYPTFKECTGIDNNDE